ncbi:hypothetical protein [Paenibacillus lautus]|uniref:hypothetical protein n=1 Tax=Paenibacillus lautus TaxID=1401 RepID=UPI001C7D5D18|nr:hypothetical protein [Paenibacillus lautus]MBX4150747.1 hypothetical protein [Paenibacillus lautus]
MPPTTEVDISVKNKTSDRQLFISEHFKDVEDLQIKVFKVTFLLTNTTLEISRMYSKIFSKSFEALSEIRETIPPKNDSKTQFTLESDVGEQLYFNLSCIQSEYNNENIYEVRIEGQFDLLEQYRTIFIKEVKSLCTSIYCIEDEISNTISIAAYPIVRVMENSLREYIVRFFLRKFGSKWWDGNSTTELKAKASDRKKTGWNNLNMELYNIDFVELTELLAGRFMKTDGEFLLKSLDEIASFRQDEEKFNEHYKRLRSKFLDNWEKYFKSEIEVENFINDWKEMYEVRCEVAHNSLLSLNRFIKLTQLHDKLKENLVKLINQQRIIKLPEYKLLEEVLSLQIKFTKDDVENLINDSLLFISSVNFGYENMTVDDFNEKVNVLRTELKIFGEVTISDTQVSGVDEGEDLQNGIPSTNVEFSCIPEEVIKALHLGLTTNKFQA